MAFASERDKVAHLLRRTGFGLDALQLEHCTPLGVLGTVDLLLAEAQQPEDPGLDVWLLRRPGTDRLPPPAVAGWWAYRMLTTASPLREKLTLFWHDHFGCSGEKVKAGALLYQHLELLRTHALGRFDVLLKEVARDPTMLVFLDGQDNMAGQPNENFARELLELYTLGIGHYTEQDVQEAARAFTGWRVERPAELEYLVDPHPLASSTFRPRRHDGGTKTVLGRTGALTGDDVLAIALNHPATARHIATKLWTWFAYENPEPDIVDALARGFVQSGWDIAALLRQILTHPRFYSEQAQLALYKQPADFVIGTLRSIGFGPAMRQRLDTELAELSAMGEPDMQATKKKLFRPLRFITESMAAQGQRLLFPPSVAGWDGGSAWVNSATLLERIKFAEIFAPPLDAEAKARRVKGQNRGGNRRGRVPVQLVLGPGQFANVRAAVEHISQRLDAPLPAEKLALVADAVGGKVQGVGTRAERQTVVHETARLLFAAPEYQFM
jgi:uncharacterized protein (DUF1800 family)